MSSDKGVVLASSAGSPEKSSPVIEEDPASKRPRKNTKRGTSIVLASSPDSLLQSRPPLEEEEEEPNDSGLFSKDVIFVGKGNPQPSKYIIIPKDFEKDVKTFADSFLLRGLDKVKYEDDRGRGFFATKPGVLISVTGGAQDFYMHSSKLEQVFNRGLMRAAQNINAWIVDGGLDAGVMQYVGKAIKDVAVADVPCIGIASHKMVILNEMLSEQLSSGKENAAEYVANQPNSPSKCALNPNHTHFILVDSPTAQWGQEILFRSELEKYLRDKYDIPVVQIVVNGGPGTLETVGEAAKNNFAIVVVQGSGRACDAIAAMVRKAKLNDARAEKERVPNTCAGLMHDMRDDADLSPWHRLLAEARGNQANIAKWSGFMDKILENYKAITLFSAEDEAAADMDIFILRAILNSPGQKLSMAEKLRLGVVWDRADIITEIIDTEKDALSSNDHRRGLNEALELSLLLDRPQIFSILSKKGAQKDAVNLKKLYFYKPIKPYLKRLPAYTLGKNAVHKSSNALKSQTSTDALPLPGEGGASMANTDSEFSEDTPRARSAIKMIFKTVGGSFHGYQSVLDDKLDSSENVEGLLPEIMVSKTGTIRKKKKKMEYNEESKVSYTDFLIWAILVNRLELAKAIWCKTTLPIHSALIGCQLYRFLSDFAPDKPTYMENSDWFEQEAMKVMDILDYDDTKDVLNWSWAEMGGRTALDIAGDAECKKFVGHSHMQNLLDEMFYSDKYGKIDPTTTSFRLWATILLPIPLIFGLYKNTDAYPHKPQLFYNLPIVKFWTNTLFYCGFLFVQAYVLCNLSQPDAFLSTEILLWVWVAALLLEELMQFFRDAGSHFDHLSNQMDFLLILLHLVYMILRWISYKDSADSPLFAGAVNTLIVACIFSWGRILNVFAINHSLGPLFFVITRLFKDIFLWIFVFVIFAISFQLGFVNISLQAGLPTSESYPSGSFPVAFFTIIGDWSYVTGNDEWNQTPLGIALLSIYALVAQVMLVNLLIAMMGDTYSNVSENSMEEWKFYRLEMVLENQMTSFHPPPTNLIILPIEMIRNYRKISARTSRLFHSPIDKDSDNLVRKEDSTTSLEINQNGSDYNIRTVLKKMRNAREEVVNKEEEESNTSVVSIVTTVREKLRTLANERENDRTFTEKKFKDLEAVIRNSAAGPAPVGGAVAPDVKSEVAALQLSQQQLGTQQQDLVRQQKELAQQNQVLTQQNQQILALLQQQQVFQLQLQQQLQLLLPQQAVPQGDVLP